MKAASFVLYMYVYEA